MDKIELDYLFFHQKGDIKYDYMSDFENQKWDLEFSKTVIKELINLLCGDLHFDACEDFMSRGEINQIIACDFHKINGIESLANTDNLLFNEDLIYYHDIVKEIKKTLLSNLDNNYEAVKNIVDEIIYLINEDCLVGFENLGITKHCI